MIASVKIVCAMNDAFFRSEGKLATPWNTLTAVEIPSALKEKASQARISEVTRCCTQLHKVLVLIPAFALVGWTL